VETPSSMMVAMVATRQPLRIEVTLSEGLARAAASAQAEEVETLTYFLMALRSRITWREPRWDRATPTSPSAGRSSCWREAAKMEVRAAGVEMAMPLGVVRLWPAVRAERHRNLAAAAGEEDAPSCLMS
jgi:hypothetical protein